MKRYKESGRDNAHSLFTYLTQEELPLIHKTKMKKIVLVAVAMLLSVAANAQHVVGSLCIQPKLGLNVASMTNSDGANVRLGVVTGAEIEYFVTNCVSLTGGLLYSQQGVKDSDEGLNATLKMDYVNVPLLVNVYVAKGLAVKAGLQPGYLVNDKIRVNTNGVSAEMGLEQAYREAGVDASVKSVDFSLPIGISYEINNIQLEGRYNLGLTKAITLEGESTKHNVFQFTVGYKFCL